MKVIMIVLSILILASIPYAGDRHVPWCSPSIHLPDYEAECYGYATARTYGRSWTHGTCPAHSTYGTAIPGSFFNRINYVENQIDYRDILVGDVLEFGDHAAYVVTVPSGTRSDEPDGIYVDHKLSPQTTYESTDELPGVETTYGDVLNIWRKRAAWELKVQNEYTGG